MLSNIRVLELKHIPAEDGKTIMSIKFVSRATPETIVTLEFGKETGGLTTDQAEQIIGILKNRDFDFSPFPKKPSCRVCIHAKKKGHTHHLACAHPEGGVANGPIAHLLTLVKFSSPIIEGPFGPLMVVQNKRAQEKRWSNWPFDFDPIWIESCDGFEMNSEGETDVQSI